jgi:RNA polymerase sigma-70 factor (ECF subfamily)
VREIEPIIRFRVYRTLGGRRRAGRDVHQEVDDFTQDVLVALFQDDARTLRRWDPSRGMSMANYVGLVAERTARQRLRSGTRNPWSLEPTEDGALDRAAGPSDGHARHVEARQSLRRIWEELWHRLSPLGRELLRRLFIEEESIDTICASLMMKPAAVYAWRTRILRRARTLRAEVDDSAPVSASVP